VGKHWNIYFFFKNNMLFIYWIIKILQEEQFLHLDVIQLSMKRKR